MIPIKDSSVPKGFAPATAIIIILNLLMFLQEIRLGEQVFRMFHASPADVAAYLIAGKSTFLRIHASILVSGFIHIGYIHLIGNCIFLSVFGPPLEKNLGIIRFILFYICAIYAAFYAHTFIHPQSAVPVVGASGAIAAVMGAYLIVNPRGRILTLVPLILLIEIIEVPAVIFILIWFVIQGLSGFMSMHSHSTVAWFSHIGGFLMGMGVGVHHRFSR